MKKVLALAIAGAFVVPATAHAGPASVKVTGGGKTAAGETVAFTAQNDGTVTKGQFQFNNHSETAPEKVHGTVTCVTTTQPSGEEPGMYQIAGNKRDGGFFWVRGTDGGKATEGGQNTDTIVIDTQAEEANCENDEDATFQDLATGNITVHKTKKATTAKQRRADMRAAKATANAAEFNAAAFATGLTLATLL